MLRKYIIEIKSNIILLFFLLMAGQAYAHNFTVLPESEYLNVMRPCEMNLPVTSGWAITAESLRSIEQDMPSLVSNRSRENRNYSEEVRQYSGVVIEGTKYIFVQGTSYEEDRIEYSLPYAVFVCGGGAFYWQVLYDPEKREFSRFKFHSFI